MDSTKCSPNDKGKMKLDDENEGDEREPWYSGAAHNRKIEKHYHYNGRWLIFPCLTYIGGFVVKHVNKLISAVSMKSEIENMQKYCEEEIHFLYVHFNGETWSKNLKRVDSEEKLREIMQEAIECEISVLHIYAGSLKDYDLVQYVGLCGVSMYDGILKALARVEVCKSVHGSEDFVDDNCVAIESLSPGVARCLLSEFQKSQDVSAAYPGDDALKEYCNNLACAYPGSFIKCDNVSSSCEGSVSKNGIRVFIGLVPMRDNWYNVCMPFIGLGSACIGRNVNTNVVVATGLDAMEQTFPIAWGIIEIMDEDNWIWFIRQLKAWLRLADGNHSKFMSDMSNGLEGAVWSVLPYAEHRQCVFHIYSFFSEEFTDPQLSDLFWKCAYSTYVEEYLDNYQKLTRISRDAGNWVMRKNPRYFVRAFFDGWCRSNKSDNKSTNVCVHWMCGKEDGSNVDILKNVFDNVAMLQQFNKTLSINWPNKPTPRMMVELVRNQSDGKRCVVTSKSVVGCFSVVDDVDMHTTDMIHYRCTCRSWDVSGIACRHACACLEHVNYDVSFVQCHWYHKKCYEKTYKHELSAIEGLNINVVGEVPLILEVMVSEQLLNL